MLWVCCLTVVSVITRFIVVQVDCHRKNIVQVRINISFGVRARVNVTVKGCATPWHFFFSNS